MGGGTYVTEICTVEAPYQLVQIPSALSNPISIAEIEISQPMARYP